MNALPLAPADAVSRPVPGDAALTVTGLSRSFDVSAPWLNRMVYRLPRRHLRAVTDVSFTVPRGGCLSLVGESGCGKSTVARLVTGIYAPSAGEIRFSAAHDGTPLSAQMIFQDPYASLNPRWPVKNIIAEPLRELKLRRGEAEMRDRVTELLDIVGMNAADGEKFPHEFSGGQRQRISIARALASEPEFLVCDEPTSALDVSVQAQILNLMRDLQDRLGLTYLFISHDLSVVRHMSDRIAVSRVGFNPTIDMGPRSIQSPKRTRGETDVFNLSWATEPTLDAFSLIGQVLATREGSFGVSNYGGWSVPELDKFAHASGDAVEMPELRAAEAEALRIAKEEILMIPLWQQPIAWASTAKVKEIDLRADNKARHWFTVVAE